jgi:hypothetical protein
MSKNVEESKVLKGSLRTKVVATNFTHNAYHTFNIVKELEGSEGQSPKAFHNLVELNFQNGPIKENGVNGVTNEDLLAIVIERLQNFQDSEFVCKENAMAITKLEEAQLWLAKRTWDRQDRGVEGTHEV